MKCYVTHNLFMLDIEVIFIIHIHTKKTKKMDVVDSFCYLGDTIGAGGGCDLSFIRRIRSAWGKFRELLSILTSHALSYITRGQIYQRPA